MSNRRQVTSNFIWRLLERFGAQGVTFVVSIVLARILDTTTYGTVALITVITSILQVFVDSGLGSALIQKKEADDLDFSTVFYFNFAICLLLYILLFLASPFIASFYGQEQLTPVIRVLGLVLIISGFKNIQNAYVSRNLMFKKYFFATLGGTVTAAIIGIWMAYRGYGVWALVTQNIVNQLIDTIILWITVKWRPKAVFSFQRFKTLFSYGWKLLISSLIDTIWNQARQLIIGKKYSANDLAFYNKGQEYPHLLTNSVNASIDSVLFPIMSQSQDSKDHVKAITRKAIQVESYILWPMMIGLAACAESVICVLITEKWLPAALYLRIACVTYAFYPIHIANLNAIKAMGRSDLYMKLEILKKMVGFLLLISSMWISVEAMAYSLLIGSVASQVINSWPNKKLLNYSYLEQIKDILPSALLSLFMGGIVYCIYLLKVSYLTTLVIQIIVGVFVYFLGSKILRLESYDYVFDILKSFFKRAKKER